MLSLTSIIFHSESAQCRFSKSNPRERLLSSVPLDYLDTPNSLTATGSLPVGLNAAQPFPAAMLHPYYPVMVPLSASATPMPT